MCIKKEGCEGVCFFSQAFLLAVPGILNSKPRYAERLIHPPEFSEGSHSHFHATIRGDSGGHLDSSTKSEWLGYIDLQGYCNGIHVVDNYAYVCDSRLWIIDVSDPYNPLEVGNCGIPYFGFDVQVKDNFAYVAAVDSGLRIIDVSDPYNPFEAGHCTFPGYAYGVYIAGNWSW